MTTTVKLMMMLAGAATLSSMSIEPANAENHEVRYAASELSTISGAEHVYSEIHATAIEVCGEEYGGHRLVKYRAERERCIVEVVDELVSEVNHPQLSSVHAQATS